MEKVRPWCGQPSDRGRLRNRTLGLARIARGVLVVLKVVNSGLPLHCLPFFFFAINHCLIS